MSKKLRWFLPVMIAMMGILAVAWPVLAATPQPDSLQIQEVTVYENYHLDYAQLYIIKYCIGYDTLPTDAANKLFLFRLFDKDNDPVAIVRPYPYHDKGYGLGVAAFYLAPDDALDWETTLWDTFEWGEDGDDITDSGGGITWAKVVAGDSTVTITADQYVSGTRSMEIFRAADNARAHFTHAEASSMSFKMRKSADALWYLVHGNGTSRIIFYADATENIKYLNAAGAAIDTTYDVTVDTWHSFEVSGIDWDAGTYDLYFDTTLIGDDIQMQTNATYTDVIAFLNNVGTNSYVFIDDMEVDGNAAVYLTGDPLVDWDGGIPSTSTDVFTWRTGTTSEVEAWVAAKVLSLAAELKQDWDMSLTDTSQGTTALNSDGQAYFQAVIPYLSDTVPYVFGRYVFGPDYPIDPKPPANSYADELVDGVAGTIFALSGPARSFGITQGQLTAAIYYPFVIALIILLVMKAGLRRGAMLIAWPFVVAGAFFGVPLLITILAAFMCLLATVWIFYKGGAT